MNKETIQVIITDERPDSWYRCRVGETLEVYKEPIGVGPNTMYRMADGTRNKILLMNCRIVDLKKLFPTLSVSYSE